MKITGNINSPYTNNINPYSVNHRDIEFINLVENKITGYGMIPYQVPRNLIIDIIKSSARYFYEWYPQAKQDKFYAIKVSEIEKKKVQAGFFGNSIKLDGSIQTILRIYDTKNEHKYDSDWNVFEMQTTPSGSFINTNDTGINNNMFMIENAVRMVEISALRNMFKTTIAFTYSPLTNELQIKNIPQSSRYIILDTKSRIPLESLYNNTLFERHVIVSVKRELKRILGSHTISLPGGATLNPDEICNNLEELEQIEEKIKAMNGVGDIILSR